MSGAHPGEQIAGEWIAKTAKVKKSRSRRCWKFEKTGVTQKSGKVNKLRKSIQCPKEGKGLR